MRIRNLSLIAGAALAVSGCAYNGLGMGVGYGNDPYGYGYGSYGSPYGYGYGSPYGYGASYGSPYYGYGYDPFGRYGYGYGYAPYGWNNGYYYPGDGYYVYDRNNKPREMTASEKSYWSKRIAEVMADNIRQNRGTATTSSTSVGTQSVGSTSGATAPRPLRSRETTSSRTERSSSLSERRSSLEERRTARREAAATRRASRSED